MRLVEIAENHPNVCLVTRDTEGPFVDFEAYTEEVDPHIYLSVALVTQAAGLLDLVPKAKIEALEEKIAVLRAELARFERLLEATTILEEVGA